MTLILNFLAFENMVRRGLCLDPDFLRACATKISAEEKITKKEAYELLEEVIHPVVDLALRTAKDG